MSKRKRICADDQTEVLVSSRRRCCICFSLVRDDEIKQGQIAHLDRDNTNNSKDNLAFLCLAHHDAYDSKTSQSKGYTIEEVKSYRSELLDHNKGFVRKGMEKYVINFWASKMTVETVAKAVMDVASNQFFYGRQHALDVLTTTSVTYSDGDLYIPHLIVLDSMQAWGLAEFKEDERTTDGGYKEVTISVNLKENCKNVALYVARDIINNPDQYNKIDILKHSSERHKRTFVEYIHKQLGIA